MAENVILCLYNDSDTATLSGGSWEALLPRANMQDENIGKVARTTDATEASTKFDIDYGKSKIHRVFALGNHNASTLGKWKIQVSTVNTFLTTTYDSGWVDIIPAVYSPSSGTLPWGTFSWTGKPTTEQLAQYTKLAIHVAPQGYYGRYVRILLKDTTNSDGYLQVGRLFTNAGWQPEVNMTYDANIALNDLSQVTRTISGRFLFEERSKARVFQFGLDFMNKNEGYQRALDGMRNAGLTKQVLLIPYNSDTINLFRDSFIGYLRTLNPIAAASYGIYTTGFEIEEAL